MREELVHTDDREYRKYLKDTIVRLEVVHNRLFEALGGAPLA